MAHRRVRLSVILSLAVGLPLSSVPAFAGGFGGGSAGGGHAGGFGGIPSGRAGFAGAPNGYAASRRSGLVQRPAISRAEMNRQLVLPSDPNFPRDPNIRGRYRQDVSRGSFIQGGFFKEGYSGTRRISRDRYGNPYGSELGFGYGGGYYGYGGYAAPAYGQAGIGAAYSSYGDAEPASFAYAPPRIIEIDSDGLRQQRSHASYNGGSAHDGGGRINGRQLPIVTYGPSSASRASVGPEPGLAPGLASAGGPDLFAPRIVRVRVPKG